MGARIRRADDKAAARLAAGAASYALGIPATDIIERGRGSARTAFARHVAMYLCHVGSELSLTRVAGAFDRDRSTVAYACHLIEDRREEPQFDLWISSLETMMRAAPTPGSPVPVQELSR